MSFQKGHKPSEETRAKMRAAQKARWAKKEDKSKTGKTGKTDKQIYELKDLVETQQKRISDLNNELAKYKTLRAQSAEDLVKLFKVATDFANLTAIQQTVVLRLAKEIKQE